MTACGREAGRHQATMAESGQISPPQHWKNVVLRRRLNAVPKKRSQTGTFPFFAVVFSGICSILCLNTTPLVLTPNFGHVNRQAVRFSPIFSKVESI